MSNGVTASDVSRAQVEFHATLWGSLGICAVIHFIAPLFSDDPFLRMMLVVAFFGCLASATWSFSKPYRSYLECLYRWRYTDAGPAVQHNVERYVIRQTRYASLLSSIATFAITVIGLWVLSHWQFFEMLLSFQKLLLPVGMLLVCALPVVGIISSNQLREAIALKQQFEEEAHISGAKKRTAESESEERKKEAAPPVLVSGPLKFQAGGYEWHWSDFYKNAAIFGQSGTGKTVCVLNAILDGLMGSSSAAGLPAAGLILDPKGDFRDKITTLCAQHNRSNDLMVIDPYDLNKSIAWNPLDSDDDALELAGRFGAVMEVLSPAGSDDTFWIDSSKRLVENLIALIRYARPGEPPSLTEIYEAAMSDSKLDTWGQMIDDDDHDQNIELQRTFDYFFDVWKPMPDDTKGTVRSFVSNMLGSFLTKPFDTLFSGTSTNTISQMVENGKILYVYMPIADKETMSRVVSTFVKLAFYKEVLKRLNKERPSFFLCDEFQSFFTVGQGQGDADAFERTRQSNHANVVAFQNLNALFKQTDRNEPVLNLLGNCAVKLFLRNTDKETNEYASELFGEHIETLSSSTVSVTGGAKGAKGAGSVSGSAQYAARVKKEEFSALAVPSKEENSLFAEAIAHLAARSKVETRRMKWKVHPIE